MDTQEIQTSKQCAACQKELTEVLKCGGCGQVYYCSQSCQKANWAEHKKVCNFKPTPKPETTEIFIKLIVNYIKIFYLVNQ